MATDTAPLDHDEATQSENDAWDGAAAPFKASYGKLMMWYFLLSDAFTFAGFLIAYGALRFSMPTWPVPDFVFSTAPFGIHEWFPGDKAPLIFVTFMSFLLIVSSVTMVRGVQEGHRENQGGVVFWMLLTVIGGAGFLGCQAWEWSNLIGVEHMSITRNPFGSPTESGTYLMADGNKSTAEEDQFIAGSTYLIHKAGHGHGHGDDHGGDHSGDHGAGHGEAQEGEKLFLAQANQMVDESGVDMANIPIGGVNFPGFYLDEQGFIHRKYLSEENEKMGVQEYSKQEFGPKAFGALFFFITGFHGFHVFSGVLFLVIIMLNVASGLYVKRKNGYEMVEKIGLYWHFVDLVWVFVFLVFYLL
ncbi:MAG: cytochrome c oxidase subunit 3 [Bacteroidota bacterium]